MSLASEYLANLRRAKQRPELKFIDEDEGEEFAAAWVTEDGNLEVSDKCYFYEERALALAAWIIATFGEKEVEA